MTKPIGQTTRLTNSPIPTNSSLSQPTLTEKVSYFAKASFFTAAMLVDPFVDFFTQGLSDFLGLETLRHGTSYPNYLSIRINGADPRRGEKGASHQISIYEKSSASHFHVASDSEAILKSPICRNATVNYLIGQLFVRTISARFYTAISSLNLIKGTGYAKTACKTLLAIANTLFVPTIKFRYNLDEAKRVFTDDPHGNGLAYRAEKAISSDHMGLKGVFTQGVKGDVLERMKDHPIKSSIGLIKLLNPIGLALLSAFGLHLLLSKNKSHLN